MAKDNRETENKEVSIGREILSWVGVIVFAVALALFLNAFILVNAEVPTKSMENTIKAGDHIMGLRVSYWFKGPERGDIVVFKFPDDESQNFVKRVIGLPGDSIEIVDGKVYINGSDTPLDEPYLKDTPYGSFGTFTVPAGCYFMMGDNRNDSHDSRFWDHTYVTEDELIGKAYFKYYPGFQMLH